MRFSKKIILLNLKGFKFIKIKQSETKIDRLLLGIYNIWRTPIYCRFF
jgi:hypothetical protein